MFSGASVLQSVLVVYSPLLLNSIPLNGYTVFYLPAHRLKRSCFYFCLFFLFWSCVAFIAVQASFLRVSGAAFELWCRGFSLQWLLLVWSTGSGHVGFRCCGSWVLEYKLSSCSTQAELLQGMRGLPESGNEPVSPELAGGIFTAEPAGKLLSQQS